MSRVLLPVQILCLAVLHVAFAFSRFLTLLREFSSRLGSVRRKDRRTDSRGGTGGTAGTGESIREELNRGRWRKTPKHLAINFVRSTPVRLSLSSSIEQQAAREKQELDKLLEDIENVVHWSAEVGVEVLTLYDEHGLLETHASLAREALSRGIECITATDTAAIAGASSREAGLKSRGVKSFELNFDNPFSVNIDAAGSEEVVAVVLSRLGKGDIRQRIDCRVGERGEVVDREIDSGCGSSEVDDLVPPKQALSISTPSSTPSLFDSPIPTTSISSVSSLPVRDLATKTTTKLKINLISKSSGRDHLAAIARDLATDVKEGMHELESVDVNAVEERMESSSISDPDLLIVLGGPYLRLKGFPPWQLRLTEMYHHSSPSWLPSPRINYKIFMNALDVYGGAEMRLGR